MYDGAVPLFILFYGTKSRTRVLGALAMRCLSCGGPTRHFAVLVEESPHIYWIPIHYSPVQRLAACAGCGRSVALPEELPLVGVRESETMSIDALIAETHPALRGTRVTDIQVDRERYVRRSLASQLQGLDELRRHAAGGIDAPRILIFIAFTIVSLVVFSAAGNAIGAAMAATLLLLFAEIHRAMGERAAARAILPRLARMTEVADVTMNLILRALDGGEVRLPKLRRLLGSPAFDAVNVRVEKIG